MVMTKAYLKENLRSLLKSKGRIITIVLIIALGTGFFGGIKAASVDMKLSADKYYKESSLMDIKVISTMLLTDDDVKAIKGVDGITDAEGSYSIDTITLKESDDNIESSTVIRIHAMTDSKMNEYRLIEGREPKSANEVLLIKTNTAILNYAVGDKFKVEFDLDPDAKDVLAYDEYTVVGIAESPLYLSITQSKTTKGSGNLSSAFIAKKEAFSLDCYTEIYASVDKTGIISYDSDDYNNLIDNITDKIDALSTGCINRRYDEITAEPLKELNDAKEKLEKETASAKSKLADSKKQLDSSKAQIDSAQKQLDDAKTALSQQEEELSAKYAEFERTFPSIDALDQQTFAYATGMKSELDAASAKLESAKAELTAKSSQIAKAKAEYESGLAKYNEALDKLSKETKDAQDKIDSAQKKLDDIKKPEWYITDRSSIQGYSEFYDDAERIDAIAAVFPVFFFLVAALVCLTTMTRMVENERTQIGTLKALGYSSMTISAKYISYALVTSLIGSALGLTIGFQIFPKIIYSAYQIMYLLPDGVTPFHVDLAIIATSLFTVCSIGATIFACINELREIPASLIRPKAPKAGKRVFLENIKFIWNRLSFTKKLTVRNILRYKKRFFMTVIGIAGCTALTLTGFGVKDSISNIVKNQFENIYLYSGTVALSDSVKDGVPTDSQNKLLSYIDSNSNISDNMLAYQERADATSDNSDNKLNAYLLVYSDNQKVYDFFAFKDRKSQKELSLSNDSVMITEKLADKLNLKVGDNIKLTNADQKTVSVKVSNICENYIYNYIYMSKELYKEVYEQSPSYQIIFLKTPKGSESLNTELATEILKYDGVLNVSFMDTITSTFDDIFKSLDMVIVVLIISASLLAFVVLYNLTSINVNERIREIATIKVLGFYDSEVSRYIYRENIILTIIGVLVGLILGVFLHQYVIRIAEVDIMMFGRHIAPISYLWAALLTFAFSVSVNFAMHLKLKKIPMVESLKSIE